MRTYISELASYVSSNSSVSSVSTGHKFEETINTGYIHNWIFVSNSNKKKVVFENKNEGVKLGYWKLSKTGNAPDKPKELKKHNFKLKSNIKALKKEVT